MSKPFIERLTLDDVNLKIIRENRQKIGGFQLFKKSFLGQIWNNVKTNWLMLAFCLPVLAWIVYSQVAQIAADTTIPYSSSLMISHVVNDAHIVGAAKDFELAMNRAMYMLPLIVVGSVGLAGVFNVIKYFCWGFKIKIAKTFFRGIKNSFAPFIWVGMMLGVCYVLVTLVFNVFNVYEVALGLRIIAYIGCILLCYLVILLSVFVTTQAAVFNLTLFEILKNSFFLGTKFLLQNSMIAIVGMISMLLPFLTFNSILQIIAYTLFFMMAFSYTATVWTIYAQYVYDMMYSDKPEKENNHHPSKNPQNIQKPKKAQSAISSNTGNTAQNIGNAGDSAVKNNHSESQSQKDKKSNKTYHNPKKKKKS